MSDAPSYWLVMPAAGVGQRMGSTLAKQYLPLRGKTIIEWSLKCFLDDTRCRGVIVALSADDAHWLTLAIAHSIKVQTALGGKERAESVLAGLKALRSLGADSNDWVLVHDAARPCLSMDELNGLLACAEEEGVGALLATPMTDTLKRAATDQHVQATVPREGLWRAQTPQMFRLSLLMGALQDALAQGRAVTDEASAVESLGLLPRLVPGSAYNLKITLPEDLALAEHILAARDANT